MKDKKTLAKTLGSNLIQIKKQMEDLKARLIEYEQDGNGSNELTFQ
jgi:hypothetical protein